MPPSAGACQTTLACDSPDWGRAAHRSAIITAITCRAAVAGLTGMPVSGAATRTGVGTGVGVGSGVGDGAGVGSALEGSGVAGLVGSSVGFAVAGGGPRGGGGGGVPPG